MKARGQFGNGREFAEHLRSLRQDRRIGQRDFLFKQHKRRSLNLRERQVVFAKTAGRCHICGGEIEKDELWEADHVFAHAHGGTDSLDNYLPAHSICNNYRWFYGAEEFQWILKLGVWLRTQVEKGNGPALELAERFVRYEVNRESRRKTRD